MAEVYKEHFEDANIGVLNYRWIYPHCSQNILLSTGIEWSKSYKYAYLGRLIKTTQKSTKVYIFFI